MKIMVTLNKGGTAEKRLPVERIEIPDMWHVAQRAQASDDKQAILDCWRTAHALKNALLKIGGVK